jgi:hypothetical protein
MYFWGCHVSTWVYFVLQPCIYLGCKGHPILPLIAATALGNEPIQWGVSISSELRSVYVGGKCTLYI